MRAQEADGSREQKARALAAIEGLPQDGPLLGDPDAPATLTVFVALDDFNDAFLARDLPELAERFIRPGELKILVRTLPRQDFGGEGSSSARAALVAQAAGLQERFWDFWIQLNWIYYGYLDEADLRRAVAAVGGLDRAAIARDSRSTRVAAAVERAEEVAAQADVEAPPVYDLRTDGSTTRRISNCAGCLFRAVERLTGG